MTTAKAYCSYCGRVSYRCQCHKADSPLRKFLARADQQYLPRTQPKPYKRGVPPQSKRRERDTLRRNYKTWYTALVKSYGEHCLHCGDTEKLAIDHVVSIARGGKSKVDNLQLLCAECNRLKGKLVYNCRPHPLKHDG
jgi:5-methylcytosine-specific restriction endonuclease McrA